MKRLFFLAMALAITAPVASADIVTIYIEGVVDSVTDNGALEGKVKAGDIISGHYIYDTTIPNIGYDYGYYEQHNAPCGIFLAVGELALSSTTPPSFGITILDNRPGTGDQFGLSSNGNPLPSGAAVWRIQWTLQDPTGQAISGLELPTSAPVLEDWSINAFLVRGDGWEITGHITSAVPEPGSILLLGLAGLLLRRRS